jgi:hypothetical protein
MQLQTGIFRPEEDIWYSSTPLTCIGCQMYVRQCKSAPDDGGKMYHLPTENHRDNLKLYHLAF